jgi:hypothetical protein
MVLHRPFEPARVTGQVAGHPFLMTLIADAQQPGIPQSARTKGVVTPEGESLRLSGVWRYVATKSLSPSFWFSPASACALKCVRFSTIASLGLRAVTTCQIFSTLPIRNSCKTATRVRGRLGPLRRSLLRPCRKRSRWTAIQSGDRARLSKSVL